MDDRQYGDGTGLFGNTASWDQDIGELLERSQISEKERLEQELERINEQLEGRDEVHEEITDELEWKVDWYTDRLETLYKRGTGRAQAPKRTIF